MQDRVLQSMWSSKWRLAFAVASIVAVSGCASVQVSVPRLGGAPSDGSDHPQTERIALHQAAEALADQPWGTQAPPSGLTTILFGAVATSGRDRAVEAYLAQRRAPHSLVGTAILSDTEVTLALANEVHRRGRDALAAAIPLISDVDVLETSIAELREARMMYTLTLRLVVDKGLGGATELQIDDVRERFDTAIAGLDQVAHDLTVKLRDAETPTRLADSGAASAPPSRGP